jgi:hypothetical protein
VKKIVLLSLFILYPSSAKFLPTPYFGYQRMTKSIALEQLDNPIFNNPAGIAILEINGWRWGQI